MPAARLLVLAPPPAQQLQFLRSATTTTAAMHPTCASAHGSSSNSRPSRSRNQTPGRVATTAALRMSGWCGCLSTTPASPSAFLLATRVRPARPSLHRSRQQSAAFNTATPTMRTAFPRHGKAIAPDLPPGIEPTPAAAAAPTEAAAAAATADAKKTPEEQPAADVRAATEEQPKKRGQRAKSAAKKEEGGVAAADDAQKEATPAVENSSDGGEKADAVEGAAAAAAEATLASAEAAAAAPPLVIELGPPTTPAGPIDTIFTELSQDGQGGEGQPGGPGAGTATASSSSSSSSTSQSSQRQTLMHKPPPHLVPPPYVHHFDSYSLVKQLESSGFTQEQAITAMKAVRGLLGVNLDMAESNLVSKSDVENEAYLFKAACAELGIEVRNNRRRADEEMRQQRTLLQHEVDIAAQSVNQELLTLNDTVRGLFNDRKMAVREEHKTMESAIQKLSYKIATKLNSELRSQIEGLRWVLVRRAVLGIIFMFVVTLSSLRYASYVSHVKERQAEMAAKEAEAMRHTSSGMDLSSHSDAAEILAN